MFPKLVERSVPRSPQQLCSGPINRPVAVSAGETRWHTMKADTPITLAAAKYPDRQLADEDFDRVWSVRGHGEFDHTAVAVLTKDANGKLDIDRHDSTTKHLAWAVRVSRFSHPGSASQSALVAARSSGTSTTTSRRTRSARRASFSSPDRPASSSWRSTSREPTSNRCFPTPRKTSVTQTTAGNLQAEIDKELAEAEAGQTDS